MQRIALSPRIISAFLVLLLGLAGTDAFLALRLRQQRAQLELVLGSQTAQTPAKGQQIPVLAGTNLFTGKGYALQPDASPPLALLVFRESCRYCEENWKNWDELFSDKSLRVVPIFISSDKMLSDDYRKRHPLLSGRRVILGADSKLLESLHLASTPQTVFIVGGKVKQDWLGVLDAKELKEIKGVMSDASS